MWFRKAARLATFSRGDLELTQPLGYSLLSMDERTDLSVGGIAGHQLRSLMEDSPAPVFIVDERMMVSMWSPGMAVAAPMHVNPVGRHLLDLPYVNDRTRRRFCEAIHRQIARPSIESKQTAMLHLQTQRGDVLLEMEAKVVDTETEQAIVLTGTGRGMDPNLATLMHNDSSFTTREDATSSETNISSITAPTFPREFSDDAENTNRDADEPAALGQPSRELGFRILRENNAAGAVAPLVALLSSGNTEYKTRAATALGILAFGSEELAADVAAAGAVQPLVAQLTTGNDNGKVQAAAALRNLAHGCEPRAAFIVASGAVDPLVVLFQGGDAAGKANAAAALRNLSSQSAVAAAALETDSTADDHAASVMGGGDGGDERLAMAQERRQKSEALLVYDPSTVPPPLEVRNAPGRWDFFLSHTQRNADAKLLASEVYLFIFLFVARQPRFSAYWT